MSQSYALVDTAIGICGVAWSGARLTRVQLPEADGQSTALRLQLFTGAIAPTEPPAAIASVVEALQRYFGGHAADFLSVAVDYGNLGAFETSVCEETRKVPWGTTVTYGELARRVGDPDAARAIGRAMSRNPVPIVVPCHRVLAAGGKMGGFSAYGGTVTKAHLLRLEGVAPGADAGQLSLAL